MNKIKVSIVVPIYNTKKYLKKCMDSLVSQTLKEIEIILINDGSTEDIDSIVNEYNDNRIIYIKKDNTGIGSTRNLGIQKSKGEFLLFVDSDDYIDENYAKKAYEKAIIDEVDIVISDFYKDYDGKLKEETFDIEKIFNMKEKNEYLWKINLGPCNKLYKRELIENIKFNENTKYEDAPFVVEALLKANKISYLKEFLSYYVIHSNSETTIRDNRIFDILSVSKQIIDICNKYNVNNEDITNLIVLILTDYTIQTRYIKDWKIKKKFINEAFDILSNINPNWKNAKYLKKYPFFKRVVKTNKTLTLVYCEFYSKIKSFLK